MKLLLKILKYLGALLAVLLLTFLLGPRPDFQKSNPVIEPLNLTINELDDYVRNQEAKVTRLKPYNQSQIIWADSVRKTPWAIVYLHGFSASPMEGDPVHLEFAKRYGCNLYLARLAGHGRDDEDSFIDLRPEDLIASAKEAIAIGQQLGEKLLLMSCSTGSTLSIYLSAENPEIVDAQLMFSPNIVLHDPSAKMMTGPWGAQLVGQMVGTHRDIPSFKGRETENYWTTTYHTNGLIALQALLDECMKEEVFEKISSPYFIAYYYKNENERDKVISIDAIKKFDAATKTPEAQKQLVAMPDVDSHVIISRMQSKDLESVRQVIYKYTEEVLGVNPVSKEEAK